MGRFRTGNASFLPEEYLQFIKTALPGILPQVSLYSWKDDENITRRFAGVAERKIKMLFIQPGFRNRGIGRELIVFCVQDLNANEVDVNEQNGQAIGFYEKMGFKVTGRKSIDGMGRPFPLLEMKYNM